MNPLSCYFPHGLRIDQNTTDAEKMGDFAVDWHIVKIQLKPGGSLGRTRALDSDAFQLGLSENPTSTRVDGTAP